MIQISHYISLDPALTAKILKTANSPLYKSRRTSSNIRQAVCVLGTHAVISIALSFSLTRTLMQHTESSIGKPVAIFSGVDRLLPHLQVKRSAAKLTWNWRMIYSSRACCKILVSLPFLDHSWSVCQNLFICPLPWCFASGRIWSLWNRAWRTRLYLTQALESTELCCDRLHDEPQSIVYSKGEPTIADCVAASGYIADYFKSRWYWENSSAND